MDSGGYDVRSLFQSFHDGWNNRYFQVYQSNSQFFSYFLSIEIWVKEIG